MFPDCVHESEAVFFDPGLLVTVLKWKNKDHDELLSSGSRNEESI